MPTGYGAWTGHQRQDEPAQVSETGLGAGRRGPKLVRFGLPHAPVEAAGVGERTRRVIIRQEKLAALQQRFCPSRHSLRARPPRRSGRPRSSLRSGRGRPRSNGSDPGAAAGAICAATPHGHSSDQASARPRRSEAARPKSRSPAPSRGLGHPLRHRARSVRRNRRRGTPRSAMHAAGGKGPAFGSNPAQGRAHDWPGPPHPKRAASSTGHRAGRRERPSRPSEAATSSA